MITAQLSRNTAGQVVAFEVTNHGNSHVCAAVSMLVLNTVNAIEALTKAQFDCDYAAEGGYITFRLTSGRGESHGREAGLLLDAMALGLQSTADQYPQELTMKAM